MRRSTQQCPSSLAPPPAVHKAGPTPTRRRRQGSSWTGGEGRGGEGRGGEREGKEDGKRQEERGEGVEREEQEERKEGKRSDGRGGRGGNGMGGDERGEEREERGGEVKGEGRAQKGRGGERERGEGMETGKRVNGRLQPTHTVTRLVVLQVTPHALCGEALCPPVRVQLRKHGGQNGKASLEVFDVLLP